MLCVPGRYIKKYEEVTWVSGSELGILDAEQPEQLKGVNKWRAEITGRP